MKYIILIAMLALVGCKAAPPNPNPPVIDATPRK